MSGFFKSFSTKNYMEGRLKRELTMMAADPLPGITLNKCSVNSTLSEWIVDIDGAPDTAYEGEKFQLQFKFCPSYPLKSPQVIFLGPNIPVNPHVYSNGHICLSILSNEWNPTSSTQSICLSIISMLSSCKEKKRPIDDILYVATCNKDPRKTIWWYHDDSV